MEPRAEAKTTGQADGKSPRRPPRIRLSSVLVLAGTAAISGLLLLLLHEDDEPEPSVALPPAATSGPQEVSLRTLKERAAQADQPIYWVGARPGRKYELTETPDGSRIYVRYLPQNALIGAQRPFLTVATYRTPNAFEATQAVARLDSSTTIRIGNGGVAFYASDSPTSLYIAYPREDYQIEVFDPRPDIARELVRSGQVRPVGNG